ncbi:MAG: undecaprenyl/decaprenyl-phosphate alpha-N-acetylglucosaminyl 1-phosphate transferase [Spirochaetaceae bacterium]|nr:MAG: undecaprenyl/decaprenyl-phosphate alpha-N-acetylglucosaminyl 1-phosphate transferase [Spirochaetaceae bacterium]
MVYFQRGPRRIAISGRIAAIALAAFLANALITPVILAVAHRFNWYDDTDHRKIHSEDTPRLGGIGIFLAFVIVALGGIYLVMPPDHLRPWSSSSLALMLGGLLAMHGLGVYDDFTNLRAPLKFLIQIFAGVLVALSGATFQRIALPFVGTLVLPGWIAFPLTVLWIVSISNALNLIDGADGLAGGVAMIAVLFMGIIAFGQGSLFVAVISFALFGATAGFLLFNFPPARIFMGDGGSLTLGFLLALIPLMGITGNSAAPMTVPVITVLTLLYVPIVDTILAIIRRSRRGLPVHSPDREHIHHRLIDRGVHGRRLLAVIYSGMIVLGFTAIITYTASDAVALLLTALVWAGALVAIILLGKHENLQD